VQFSLQANGYIESFNGRLRDECLNGEVFFNLIDAREKLERWRSDYNGNRPHSALADRTPQEFAQVSGQRSFALPTVVQAASLASQGFAYAGQQRPALDLQGNLPEKAHKRAKNLRERPLLLETIN